MSFTNVKFYYGTEDNYNKLLSTDFFVDNNKDNNYFFYTTKEIEENGVTKTVHKLFLKDILIYDSNAKNIDPWSQISEPLADTLRNYIKKVENEQNITGNLTISGNIQADNFQENSKGEISFGGNKTLDIEGITTNKAQIATIETTKGGSIIKGENNEVQLNKLIFDSATESIVQNIPKLQFQFGDESYYLDLNNGELKIKHIKCSTLEYDSNIVQADTPDLSVNSITIGNVRLEDDGEGNLKITSLTKD